MKAKKFLTENSDWFDKSPGGEKLYFESEVIRMMNEYANEALRIHDVSGCFYLQSEKAPDNSGEYEVITNRGRVIKIKYKLFEDYGIWESEYGAHEINESVVAWRFLK